MTREYRVVIANTYSYMNRVDAADLRNIADIVAVIRKSERAAATLEYRPVIADLYGMEWLECGDDIHVSYKEPVTCRDGAYRYFNVHMFFMSGKLLSYEEALNWASEGLGDRGMAVAYLESLEQHKARI